MLHLHKAQEACEWLNWAWLVAFYCTYAPDKEANIDNIMEMLAGHLEVLDVKLQLTYEKVSIQLWIKSPVPKPSLVSKDSSGGGLPMGTFKFLATVNQGLNT